MCMCAHETVSYWYVHARVHALVFDRTTVAIAHFMSICDLHLPVCRADRSHLYFFTKNNKENVATYLRVYTVCYTSCTPELNCTAHEANMLTFWLYPAYTILH